MQAAIHEYIEFLGRPEFERTDNQVKNQSITVIESLVRKMETLVGQSDKVDSVLEQLQEAIVSHASLVKRSAIKIDGLVNCIKNTNNYLFESVAELQGKSLLKRYAHLTQPHALQRGPRENAA
jgi:hypothetical protein